MVHCVNNCLEAHLRKTLAAGSQSSTESYAAFFEIRSGYASYLGLNLKHKERVMETDTFIIARWALTFGVPLAFAWYQLRELSSLRRQREEQRA